MAKPKPPSLEILDAQLTGAIGRARYLDDGSLEQARAIRDRLRRGDDRSAIAEALAALTKAMDAIEDRRRGRG